MSSAKCIKTERLVVVTVRIDEKPTEANVGGPMICWWQKSRSTYFLVYDFYRSKFQKNQTRQSVTIESLSRKVNIVCMNDYINQLKINPVIFVVICYDISFRSSGRVHFSFLHYRSAAKARKCPTTMTCPSNIHSYLQDGVISIWKWIYSHVYA